MKWFEALAYFGAGFLTGLAFPTLKVVSGEFYKYQMKKRSKPEIQSIFLFYTSSALQATEKGSGNRFYTEIQKESYDKMCDLSVESLVASLDMPSDAADIIVEIRYTFQQQKFRAVYTDTIVFPPVIESKEKKRSKMIVMEFEHVNAKGERRSLLDRIHKYGGPRGDFHGVASFPTKWLDPFNVFEESDRFSIQYMNADDDLDTRELRMSDDLISVLFSKN